MTHLTRAHQELFRRMPDEHFSSLPTLSAHCRDLRDQSVDRWELPQTLRPASTADFLQLGIGGDGAFLMNDWSFGQLCRLAAHLVRPDEINQHVLVRECGTKLIG